MSHTEIAATGVADAPLGSSESGWDKGCRVLVLRAKPLGGRSGGTIDGAVSPRNGLETIYATRLMAMPNGLRIGSTLQEVRDALSQPELVPGEQVTIRATAKAVYVVQVRRAVASIALELRQTDCGP